MSDRTLEDEINPPLSSTLVTDPEAVLEEVRGEDAEIAQMQRDGALEKMGQESVTSEEVQSPKPPILDFPDGGYRAWLLVFGAWLISFCTFGFVNSFGIFEAYYSTHQLAASTPSDIAWIGSFQVLLRGSTSDQDLLYVLRRTFCRSDL